MDSTRFPPEIPGVIGGKSFLEIFETQPKIIEFVNTLWTADKTTGVFKEFFVYVKNRLEVPDLLAAHKKRCCQFVKGEEKIPSYLQKYVASKINTI